MEQMVDALEAAGFKVKIWQEHRMYLRYPGTKGVMVDCGYVTSDGDVSQVHKRQGTAAAALRSIGD
jgi:hypothetical protein